MIGDFRFEAAPLSQHVSVSLFWEGDARMAKIVAPAVIGLHAARNDLPPIGPAMPVASALAYAVFLAAGTGTPLTISGDHTVWPKEWGNLRFAH